MTDDEIVRLYKTSTGRDVEGYYNTIEELKKFAEAVAKAAVMIEREDCAVLCESIQDFPPESTPYDCAKAIRAKK